MHIALSPLDLSQAARRPEVASGEAQPQAGPPEALAGAGQRPIEAPPRGDPPDAHGHDLSRDQRRRPEGERGHEEDVLDPEAQKMAERDREVRRHEAAHAAAAGRFGGAPVLHYERGPDGKRYAVSGEVPIDLAPVKGDPKATIRKMNQIRRAALSPADPSPRDRQVASRAAALAAQARAELAAQQRAALAAAKGEADPEAKPGEPPKEAASVAARRKAAEAVDEMIKRSAGAKAYLRSLGSGPRALGRPGAKLHVVRGRPRA